jgi:hypothetical protein
MHIVIVEIPGRPSVRARVDSLEDAARLAAVLATVTGIRTRLQLPAGEEIDIADVVSAASN